MNPAQFARFTKGLKVPGKPHIHKELGWWWIKRPGQEPSGQRTLRSITRVEQMRQRPGSFL